jgi:hypothetical protein
MFRAPLLMAALFAALSLLIGLVVRRPGPFAALALLGTAVIILLGYAYVGVTVAARRLVALVTRGASHPHAR